VAVVRREPAGDSGAFRLRAVYASDEDYSRDLGHAAFLLHRLELAATDPGHPLHDVARQMFDTPCPEQGSRLQIPAEFSPGIRAHQMDVQLPVDAAPADFASGHPDFDVLFLMVDVATGTAKVMPQLSANATQRAKDRITKITARGGEETDAAVVVANQKLFEPGDDDLGCLVVVSFHPDADASYLRELAKYMSNLRGKEFPRDADKHVLAKMASEDRFVRYRRRELPLSMTDGVPVYLCDLLVHRPFLPTKAITNRILVIAAERGRRGWVELLPPGLPG
jgi:hypothetical protein